MIILFPGHLHMLGNCCRPNSNSAFLNLCQQLELYPCSTNPCKEGCWAKMSRKMKIYVYSYLIYVYSYLKQCYAVSIFWRRRLFWNTRKCLHYSNWPSHPTAFLYYTQQHCSVLLWAADLVTVNLEWIDLSHNFHILYRSSCCEKGLWTSQLLLGHCWITLTHATEHWA